MNLVAMSGNAPNQRPIISLGPSPLLVAGEFAAAIAIVVSVAIVLRFWSVLPDRIPIHFGFSGRPDNWGDKLTIWIMPAVAAIMFVGFAVLSRYPHTFNYPVPITAGNARKQYVLARGLLVALKAEMCWLFAFIVRQQILVALGNAQSFSMELVWGWLFLMLGTVGLYLLRAYLNR